MRDGGIAKFTWQKQSLSRLRRQLPLHKGATAAAGLLIGKSFSRTTRLAGGFRKISSFVELSIQSKGSLRLPFLKFRVDISKEFSF